MARVKKETNKCQTTTLLDMPVTNMTKITRSACRQFCKSTLDYLKEKEDCSFDEILYIGKLAKKIKELNEYEKTLRERKDFEIKSNF